MLFVLCEIFDRIQISSNNVCTIYLELKPKFRALFAGGIMYHSPELVLNNELKLPVL